MKIKIPEYIIQKKYQNKNLIFQLGFKETQIDIEPKQCEEGYVVKNILEEEILITNGNRRYTQYKYVLKYETEELNEDTKLRWYRFKVEDNPNTIKSSYDGNYNIKKEIIDKGNIIKIGLRTPQVGAIHSILSNITNPKFKNGIIVMPTETGKTEVMITSFLSEEIERLLVITPSNSLRSQISNKFKTLGILKEIGIINEKCKYPKLWVY